MSASTDQRVFPGDTLKDVKSVKGVTILGPGLKRNSSPPNSLRITRPGKLRFRPPNTYWVDHTSKRYIPKRGDLVVGVIMKKSGDLIKIDIGSSEFASLSMLAFEGATKKQKPDVQVGDVIYGKLLNAHKEMEPEMVCIDSYFKAGKMGVLSNDGFVVNFSLDLIHRLLDPENPLLRTLGKKFGYEIAVGMNGKVWIRGKSVKDVLAIVNCFESVQGQDDKVIADICRKIK